MKKISQEWLDSAQDDIETIEEIIDRKNLTNVVAFHAQQSIEKSLKALIEEFNLEFAKTHKLMMLFDTVKDVKKFDIEEDIILKLDSLYIESRYPSSLGLLPDGKPSIEEAKEFQRISKKIYNSVKDKLLKQ